METIVNALIRASFSWIAKELEKRAFNDFLKIIINTEFQLFNQRIVLELIDLFRYIGFALLLVGILFAIVDFSVSQIEGNKKDFGWFFKNILLSIIVCFLLRDFTIELFQSGNRLLGIVLRGILSNKNGVIDGYVPVSVIMSSMGDVGVILNVVIPIVYIYKIFKILIALYKRSAFFAIHLCIGFFHMFALPSGRWDGFFAWCRLAMGLIVGNILQVSAYFLGITIYTNLDTNNPIMSIVICLAFLSASAEVDKLLIFFGIHGSSASFGAYGNAVKRSASSAVSVANKVVNMTK